VFGDGGNDIEMFKWAKHGVAMGNSREELLEHATEVIGKNNSDAIAEWIEENLDLTPLFKKEQIG
jgi:hydroxymethylpyrimidine pyrophosphatase-like HAD family hydrolase